MQSDWLAQYLVRQAEPLNQAYRLARQGDPVQFANTFTRFIHEALAPLLARLDHWPSERKATLVETAYNSGLTMARHGWLVQEHQAVTEQLFLELFPDWLSPYPEDAARLVTQVLNALSHLPNFNQRARFITQLQACLPTPDATPDALVIISWMSGLPQFRDAALAAIERRPNLPASLAIGDTALFENPWWQGPQLQWHINPIQLGASVWLGGEFTCRPRLVIESGHTLIQTGSDCWQLHADAFGQTLLPYRQHDPSNPPVPDCMKPPAQLASNWRDSDRVRQCLERRHDWVVSFHTRYAVLVIPKVGDNR